MNSLVSFPRTLRGILGAAAILVAAALPAHGAPPPCGQPPIPPAVDVGTGPRDDEQEWISEAVATLEGASETGFTAASVPFTFRLSCPTLKAGTDSVVVYDNGMPLPYNALALTDNSVTLTSGLASGRHKVELVAQDIYGFTIEKSVVIWIGNYSIAVLVTDEAGAPVPGATVVAKLSDDPKVTASLVTDANGRGTFTRLPNRSYNIVATTADNRLATRPAGVFDGLITLRLMGFKPSSAIDNPDSAALHPGYTPGLSPGRGLSKCHSAPVRSFL